mgnify:CR=1 FL=1
MARKIIMLTIVLAMVLPAVLTADDTIVSDMNKVSYSIGYDIGKSMNKQELGINTDNLIKGIHDGYKGINGQMSDTEMIECMMNFRKELMERQRLNYIALAEKNRLIEEQFLAENSKKEGVITLPSGLQYKILKAGTGDKPKDTDTIVAHYIGTFTDDKEFDNSYKRGVPLAFTVNGVIPGWTEILQLMPVGSKWQVIVPSKLGYGEEGAGAVIGPNQPLIFEIELLDIKK